MKSKAKKWNPEARIGKLQLIIAAALVGLCLMPLSVLAFDVEYDIQPRVLQVGEAATCQFTIRGLRNPPVPQLPTIDGIQVSGPSRQNNFSVINGQIDNSSAFSYRLVPLKAGKFSIGPFAYAVQGQSVQLPMIELHVAPTDQTAAGASAQNWSDLLFAQVSASHTSVYHQQIFDITISLYSHGLNMGREISLLNMPQAGLSLDPFQELQSSRQVINNRVYDVRTFRAKARALSAGTFSLEPGIRMSVITHRKTSSHRSFFDDPFFNRFFGNTESHPIEITASRVDIQVLPLPTEGRPDNFSGAVGRFDFQVEAKPQDLHAGDPITLSMMIQGQGTIDVVSSPKLEVGDGFRTYEPKLINKEAFGDGSGGRKLFEQVLIPKTEEITELPALKFSYFDPERQQYVEQTRGPFPITVKPSLTGAGRLVQGAGQTEPTALLLGSDLVYLKAAPAKWQRTDEQTWYRNRATLGLQALPPVMVMAVFLLVRRRESLESDVAKARRQKAPRSARAGMLKAKHALSQGNASAFYEGIWESLSSYFANRLNLGAGEVSRDRVTDSLRSGGATEETIQSAIQLFDRCDAHRFAATHVAGDDPSNLAETLSATLQSLNTLLRACERIKMS